MVSTQRSTATNEKHSHTAGVCTQGSETQVLFRYACILAVRRSPNTDCELETTSGRALLSVIFNSIRCYFPMRDLLLHHVECCSTLGASANTTNDGIEESQSMIRSGSISLVETSSLPSNPSNSPSFSFVLAEGSTCRYDFHSA